MKISVKRTGGYAGLTEDVAIVDTAELDAVAARQVEAMMQDIAFFDLPAVVSKGTVGADLFHYEIAVTEGHRQHAVAFDDDHSPETAPLCQLVEALIKMA